MNSEKYIKNMQKEKKYTETRSGILTTVSH